MKCSMSAREIKLTITISKQKLFIQNSKQWTSLLVTCNLSRCLFHESSIDCIYETHTPMLALLKSQQSLVYSLLMCISQLSRQAASILFNDTNQLLLEFAIQSRQAVVCAIKSCAPRHVACVGFGMWTSLPAVGGH
jgi:hypothetical protein